MHRKTLRRPWMRQRGMQGTVFVLVLGLAALIWIVVRVIPKPSRASYPCMRVATSLAAGFILQVSAFALSALSLLGARKLLQTSRHISAALLMSLGVALPVLAPGDVPEAWATYGALPQPANEPMGEARGIFPGRVVWVHDPAATNENCVPGLYGHGWFLAENNNQPVIDSMVSRALRLLTGRASDSAAWDAIFRFHNALRGKGDVGYRPGEKVFIKINVTSSWSGNINTADLSKVYNQYYGISETSPQLVLSLLRQLVRVVGVAEQDISVGDPIRHIYKHCYDLWHGEFGGIHYLDHDGWAGREKVVPSQTAVIRYSDRGRILRTGTWSDAGAGDPVTEDHLYTVFEQAEYMLNIPTLKGHKHAGMTAFAKNHFGSHTREDAKHLHGGLVAPEANNPRRQGYGLYRVQVDLMGHALLGAKNLLYLMDGLWTSDYEIDDPDRWRMPPFNDDWMSSVFVSLDPVAIESVGFDFLRAEFTAARGLATYPQMTGVDDYLHQAADSTSWPDSILYDPENDGTLLASLGTHEHWNDSLHKQYSRNLGTGNGIELLALTPVTAVDREAAAAGRPTAAALLQNYPNPCNPTTSITFQLAARDDVRLEVYDLLGRPVATLLRGTLERGMYTVPFDGSLLPSGMYLYRLEAGQISATKKLILLR